MDNNVRYYERHCDEFFEATAYLDWAPLRKPFLGKIPPGGRILDAGCGSGRDALAFLRAGYQVTAYDACPALALRAREFTGLNVHIMTHDQVCWDGEFDGLWCYASLLHVHHDQMQETFQTLARTLKSGGVWYMSFKHGRGERRRADRIFSDHTAESLATLLRQVEGLCDVDIWVASDTRPGRESEKWTNAIVCKV